jgi:LPXTG-site transpeptidase (sortase) family protein
MKKLIFVFLLIFFNFSSVFAAGPDGYISIPSLNLYKSVGFIPDSDPSPSSHFYDLTDLNYGIAHLEYTMWDNTVGGRTILVGHTPGGFEPVHDIRIGDEIIMLMNGHAYTFYVFEKYIVHKSNDAILTTPSEEFELVLLTCVDEEMRLIVKAK